MPMAHCQDDSPQNPIGRVEELSGNQGETMSTKTKAQSKTRPKDAKRSHITPRICWFEIPADNPERAKKFYGSLFGWKIEQFPGVDGLLAHRHGRRRRHARWRADEAQASGAAHHQLRYRVLGGRIRGEGRETRRHDLQAQDGGAADGLLRHLPGHGRQRVCALGTERPRKVDLRLEELYRMPRLSPYMVACCT